MFKAMKVGLALGTVATGIVTSTPIFTQHLPAYVHTRPATAREDKGWRLHGPCEVTSFRHHPGFTVMCRNGQHRIF